MLTKFQNKSWTINQISKKKVRKILNKHFLIDTTVLAAKLLNPRMHLSGRLAAVACTLSLCILIFKSILGLARKYGPAGLQIALKTFLSEVSFPTQSHYYH